MNKKSEFDRRGFLKFSGIAALGAAFGTWTYSAHAALKPAWIRLGHITDTFPGGNDGRDGKSYLHPGRLYEHAHELADDILGQFAEAAPAKVDLVVHGGGLAEKKQFSAKGHPSLPHKWRSDSSLPFEICGRESGTEKYFSRDFNGFHFIFLEGGGPFNVLAERREQLDWLERDLADHVSFPTVIIVHPPLIPVSSREDLAARDRKALGDIIARNRQVILCLCGKALANRAGFVQGTSALCLVTASPIVYPCGARLVDIGVDENETVRISSRFIQTRRLELVEKSFHRANPPSLLKNLGSREDRSFDARRETREIETVKSAFNPALAPFQGGADNVTLAVMADTHLCLDKFVSDDAREEYELIGHYAETGSKALFEDVLSQVASGRHRVEFFDEVFAADPGSEKHYLKQKVDALLIAGDLTEHGRREEAEVVKAGLALLPKTLRENTFLAIGNHDMFSNDYSTRGTASSKDLISGEYREYGPGKGTVSYTTLLDDWLGLIVLDSVIPTKSHMGLSQDQIDWLEDQISSMENKTVLVAAHHPHYHLTLVPPVMYGYLRMRSHFTPPMSATRVQLHDIFARHKNVKAVISGHYHGVSVDQFEKNRARGKYADDPYTTHIQVPCTIEYPCGYRLLKIKRSKDSGVIEYFTAYTRLAELRDSSRKTPLFKILGTRTRVPRRYNASAEKSALDKKIIGASEYLNPYNPTDLNVRGFKDGTGNFGKGNTGRPNINGNIIFSI